LDPGTKYSLPRKENEKRAVQICAALFFAQVTQYSLQYRLKRTSRLQRMQRFQGHLPKRAGDWIGITYLNPDLFATHLRENLDWKNQSAL